MPEMSSIHISCAFAFDRLTELLQAKLSGQDVGSLQIHRVDLSGDEQWMYLALQVSGPYNGRVILQFRINFDTDGKCFVLSGLKARLEEESLLAKGATWVMNNLLGDKIDARLEKALNDRFHQILINLSTQYGDFKLNNGIHVTSHLNDFDFRDIHWDQTHLYLTTVARGQLELRLDEK
jgi:hypothetical protein